MCKKSTQFFLFLSLLIKKSAENKKEICVADEQHAYSVNVTINVVKNFFLLLTKFYEPLHCLFSIKRKQQQQPRMEIAN